MNNNRELVSLGLHTYACVLNEMSPTNPGPPASLSSNSLSNLNDNLVKAVQPQIVDHLFHVLVTPSNEAATAVANSSTSDYILMNDSFLWIDEKKNGKQDPIRRCFADQQLIVSRCLPLLVNILHLSLPDKRLVELSSVLDRIIGAFELVQRDCVKLELVKAYSTMLSECSDRAALKITIVSRKFFISLLEQIRLVCLTNSSAAAGKNNEDSNGAVDQLVDATRTSNNAGSQSNENADEMTITFLHEFVRIVLSLLKNLLENSQPVKDVFAECGCYDLLYQILKDCPSEVMDIEISILIIEMVCLIIFY